MLSCITRIFAFVFCFFVYANSVAQSPVYEWANAIGTGTSAGSNGKFIQTDNSGNVYIAGTFTGVIDVDPTASISTLISYNSSGDLFFAKYNSVGNLLWARSIGGNSLDISTAMSLDNSGNIIIAGYFSSTVDLDPGPAVLNYIGNPVGDLFIEKLDPSGNLMWVKTFSNNSGKQIRCMVVDPSNNIVIGGEYGGILDLDPGPGIATYTVTGPSEGFIAKYDASGNYIWAKTFVGSGQESVTTIKCDNLGTIFVGGTFENTTDFDPSPGIYTLTVTGNNIYRDIFFGRYSSNGSFMWVCNVGGTYLEDIRELTIDNNKKVIITGSMLGSGDYDPSPGVATLNWSGGSEFFLARYDSMGVYSWAFEVGSNQGNEEGLALAIDAANNIFVSGYFEWTVDFDPGPGVANLISAAGEDFFLAKYSGNTGAYNWAYRAGAGFPDEGADLAFDISGNLNLAGQFGYVVDFDLGPSTYTVASSPFNGSYLYSFFLAKYTSSGGFISASGAKDNIGGNDQAKSLKDDPFGNVYVCGQYQGDTDFDPSPGTYYLPAQGLVDGYIAKYSGAGNLLWARHIGGQSVYCNGLTTDNSGNCYVTGHFFGTCFFNLPALTPSATPIGGEDAFLMKFAPNGTLLWVYTWGGTGNTFGTCVTCDNSGNAFVAGYFYGTADFDPGPGSTIYTCYGGVDIFMSKFDPSGTFLWSTYAGSVQDEDPTSISADNSGNIVMTGEFSGLVDFDPGPSVMTLSNTASWDIFLAKYNANGPPMWAKKMGGMGYEIGRSVCVDPSNNYIITGSFDSQVDFDPSVGTYTMNNVGGDDIFLAKYDVNGNFTWAEQMCSSSNESGIAVDVDASANVYITANYGGSMDFDPGPGIGWQISAGATDVFIGKYSPAGNYIWGKSVGSSSVDLSKSIAVDASNNVYTGGYFTQIADFDPSVLVAQKVSSGSEDGFLLKFRECTSLVVGVASQTNLSCYGNNSGALSVSVTGGPISSYVWTPNVGNTATLSGLSAGGYFCSLTSTCGVINTISVNVTQPPLLTNTITTLNPTICVGTMAGFNAITNGGTAPYTYTWSNGVGGNPNYFTPTVTAIYGGTVTDNNGCVRTGTGTIVVLQNPTVNIIMTPTALCPGSAATLVASGASNYTWSTGSNNQSITVSPNTATNYTLDGVMGSCSSNTTAFLIVLPSPTITANTSANPLCLGDAATLTAMGGNSYLWNFGSTSNPEVVTPTVDITYTVTGDNAFGCTSSFVLTQYVMVCTGIDQISGTNSRGAAIYPNPNNGLFIIEVNPGSRTTAEVYNITGQLVLMKELNQNKNEINLYECKNGLYIVKILQDGILLHTSKLVKQ